ncbi:MAG: sialidase family protein [Bacteroidota bacterium]
MLRAVSALPFILFLIHFVSPSAAQDGRYLGQTPPGGTPEVFAPDFISLADQYEFGSVFNAKGTEFYYAVSDNGSDYIRYSRLEGNTWSAPRTIMSHERYGYNDPFLSPDEQRLYFISRQTLDGLGDPKDYDIWYAEKTGDGWSKPINAGPNINTSANEYYISFTKEGTMYFSSNRDAPDDNKGNFDIRYSRFADGVFQESVVLGAAINTEAYEADVFINPDEDYIIFAANREDGYGRGDLYVSFKQADGTWSPSKNMGEEINTPGHELCPFVTMDGNYFFYTSNKDIYWVDAEVIRDLRD